MWWKLAVCAVVVACSGPSTYRFRDPIVFQRKELDAKTQRVRLAGKIWIMESDGSHLRQLTFGNTLDDHPAVYKDLQHLLLVEYPDNHQKDSDNNFVPSKIVKIDMYTGAREVLLAEPDCAYDHAILQVDDSIVYAAVCGPPPRNGPGDKRRQIHVGLGASSIAPAFGDIMPKLADQKPLVQSEWSGPPATGPCMKMGGHHVLAPDGTLYFECRAKNYRAVIGMVKPRVPDDPPRVFFDNGRWNHHFSISADGKRIVWSSDMPPSDEDTPDVGTIMLADLDGSHAEKLIDVAHSHPFFSRDGRSVLFDAIMSDRSEMYRLDLATHKLTQLTHSAPRYWSGPQEMPE